MWGLPLGLGQCSPAGRATPGAEGSRRVRRWRDQGLVGTGTLTAPVFTAAPPRGPKSHDWPSLELKAVLILESRAVKGRFWSLTAWSRSEPAALELPTLSASVSLSHSEVGIRVSITDGLYED